MESSIDTVDSIVHPIADTTELVDQAAATASSEAAPTGTTEEVGATASELPAQSTVHSTGQSPSQTTAQSSFWPRGSRKNTEISLGGTKIKVRTDATPASMKQIRELVEEKFTEFADKLEKGVSTHQLTVLVAFNLAEELLKERERNRVTKKRTVEWAERLLDRVESHLANNS